MAENELIKGFQTDTGTRKYDYESLANLPDLTHFISHNSQSLTESQKAQARKNIGAMQSGNYLTSSDLEGIQNSVSSAQSAAISAQQSATSAQQSASSANVSALQAAEEAKNASELAQQASNGIQSALQAAERAEESAQEAIGAISEIQSGVNQALEQANTAINEAKQSVTTAQQASSQANMAAQQAQQAASQAANASQEAIGAVSELSDYVGSFEADDSIETIVDYIDWKAEQIEAGQESVDMEAINKSIEDAVAAEETRAKKAEEDLGKDIDNAINNLSGQISNTKTNLEGQVSSTKTNLEGQINTAKTELNSAIKTASNTLESKITSSISQYDSGIQSTLTGMNQNIGTAQSGVSANKSSIDKLNNETLPALKTSLEGTISNSVDLHNTDTNAHSAIQQKIGKKVYTQSEEPTDASNGALWADTSGNNPVIKIKESGSWKQVSSLPEYTKNDMNKALVLGESGPAWQEVEVPELIPEYSSEDRNKILTVGQSGLEWADNDYFPVYIYRVYYNEEEYDYELSKNFDEIETAILNNKKVEVVFESDRSVCHLTSMDYDEKTDRYGYYFTLEIQGEYGVDIYEVIIYSDNTLYYDSYWYPTNFYIQAYMYDYDVYLEEQDQDLYSWYYYYTEADFKIIVTYDQENQSTIYFNFIGDLEYDGYYYPVFDSSIIGNYSDINNPYFFFIRLRLYENSKGESRFDTEYIGVYCEVW